jgi:hypothetical protein
MAPTKFMSVGNSVGVRQLAALDQRGELQVSHVLAGRQSTLRGRVSLLFLPLQLAVMFFQELPNLF